MLLEERLLRRWAYGAVACACGLEREGRAGPRRPRWLWARAGMEGACWARGGKLGLAVESEQATFCDLGLGGKKNFPFANFDSWY
jgi:hypothetical protein